MEKLRPSDYVQFLYAALGAELGVIVESSDREKLLQRLQTAKQSDQDLRRVAIVRHPLHDNQLLLIRRPDNG